jgi:DNA-binding transcriptional LysR family regulator
VAIKIFRDALTFVVSPRHKLAKKRVVDISDLGKEVFVAHIVESPFRNNVIQLFARHHVPLEMRVELPTIESIKRFVQMDMGVAIVPRMCALWELEQGLLVEVKIRQLHMRRDLYLLHRRRGPLSHAAAAMLRLLRPGEHATDTKPPAPAPPESET